MMEDAVEDTDLQAQMRSDRAYLDLGAGVTEYLTEERYYRRRNDWRDLSKLQPSKAYTRFMLPPSENLCQPESAMTSRYCHTSINKFRFPVFAVKWSPEGRRLMTASQNGEFTLWNSFGFIADKTLGGEVAVRAMTWSRSGEWLITGDMEGSLKYWNPQMKLFQDWKGHDGPIRSVSFCPTDLKFCTGSDDNFVKIWDFEARKEELTLRGHGFDVKACEWHPFKSLILSGSRDNQCKLWNPRTGKELRTIGGHKNTISVVRWNPINGNWFATASRDKTVRIYDLRYIRRDDSCLHLLEGHSCEVYSAAWHPQHEEVLATGGFDGSLLFWLVNGYGSEAHVQASVPAAHEGAIWSMDWNLAGHLLCTGSNDRTCKFWSRMRPGSTELDLYNGYLRNVTELDVMKEMNRAPPPLLEYQTFQEQREADEEMKAEVEAMEQVDASGKLQLEHMIDPRFREKALSQIRLQKNLGTVSIPGVGMIDARAAESQPGLLLVPPQSSTNSDGKNYNPDPSEVSFLSVMTSSLLERQNNNMQTNNMNSTNAGNSAPAVDPKTLPEPRLVGFVKMYDESKGFGFIRPYDKSLDDLFIQKTDIIQGYGKDGEQRLDKQDVVVFRFESGVNKLNGNLQSKAKEVIHEKYDPERVQLQKSQQRDEPRSRPDNNRQQQQRRPYDNDTNRHDTNRNDSNRGGRYNNDRDGRQGNADRYDNRDRHDNRQGNRSRNDYDNRPPPDNRPARHNRPNPEELLYELQKHKDNPDQINAILTHYGVSVEDVQLMITEQNRSR